jgi:hypothetical protein
MRSWGIFRQRRLEAILGRPPGEQRRVETLILHGKIRIRMRVN